MKQKNQKKLDAWKPRVGAELFQRKSGRHNDRRKAANKKACRKPVSREE
jgi:hypothetical protein